MKNSVRNSIMDAFYRLNRAYRLEVSYRLSHDQNMSPAALNFIIDYKGSPSLTEILNYSYLQIIAWDKDTPVAVFRESSRDKEPKSLLSFLVSTQNYYNYKQAKNGKHSS